MDIDLDPDKWRVVLDMKTWDYWVIQENTNESFSVVYRGTAQAVAQWIASIAERLEKEKAWKTG